MVDTPVEKTLVEIWADLLALPQVGIYDKFLELGGHSLLATQIVTRILDTFQVQLPLSALFEAPTIADMALVITQHQAEQNDPADLEALLNELENLPDESI